LITKLRLVILKRKLKHLLFTGCSNYCGYW